MDKRHHEDQLKSIKKQHKTICRWYIYLQHCQEWKWHCQRPYSWPLFNLKWVFKWKMLFNPNPTKPARERNLLKKERWLCSSKYIFSMMYQSKELHAKNISWRIYLDEKLDFKMQIETVLCKVNKGISTIKKLKHTLPRKSLLTIYKAFLRSHIDYGHVIYDQHSNQSFFEKLESVQYKAALAIIGAIQAIPREKKIIWS